jgi:hypothetical protein
VPGTPAPNDATCNGVDEDCSGSADEDYVPNASCGQGYCRTTNTPSRCTAGVETACQPGSPRANDDATADGVDDDCDGQIDEDACTPRTETFGAGTRTLNPLGCRTLTVRLWGGGGAAGSNDGGEWGLSITGGHGGAGGYATQVVTLNTGASVELRVGIGGKGCAAGTGADTTYRGGQGGTNQGDDGDNGGGSASGGNGANPSSGGGGGDGLFGGGGGGAGARLFSGFGPGGDGGGASVLLVNGTVSVLAGGGGGGGGAGTTVIASGASGGDGGRGCSGNGATETTQGGGGGGGGRCQGTTTNGGSGRTPFNAGGVLPNGPAIGGNNGGECAAGGDGYATITYAP